MPVRIQRKRTKGWKMPDNTVYVGRGTAWGNPYKIGAIPVYGDCGQTLEEVLWAYENLFLADKDVSILRGKNLACFCALDKPCHADILLKLANTPDAPTRRRGMNR